MKKAGYQGKTRLKAAVATFLLAFFAGPLLQDAAAQIADKPCDPQYMQSLEARAWLEAQREITQNQNLIFKPDSVMEYTCFDKYLGELADHAKDMFSDTNRWGVVYGDMATALTIVVGTAFDTYWSQNFQHSELGGRSGTTGYQPTISFFPSNAPVVTPDTYSCDMMNRVWRQAKCASFIANPTHDGFYTFEEYRDGPEHRFLPTPCGPDGRWGENIQIAYEEPQTPWTEDRVVTYFDRLEQCGPPIPTGIIVRRPKQQPTQFIEMICVAPGCHYVPSAFNQGACVGN